jgi:aromatic-L-amino-acid decarboxylase
VATAPPTSGELRAALEQAAEWCADYLDRVGDLPVLARVEPGEIAAALPEHAPTDGEPLADILADVDRILIPGITHWNHPGFMAYFGISGSAPGILGETVAAALNVNAMLWRTSPAATELEQRVLRWVAELVGLPPDWFGEITDTASASTMYALAAAREAAGLDIRTRGMAGRTDLPPLRMYTSDQAHSSVEKACIALGLGQEGLTKIPCDGEFRMRADLLAEAVAADVAAGVRPLAVVATVGTTSTTSVDPVSAVADVCAEHGMWLHVDAAYGGSAAVVPEMRGVMDGCERADSVVVNPHKWLFTPVDCSALWTRRAEAFRDAFSLVPEYLRTTDEAESLSDYGPALGRRFRSLKLWAVLRCFGAEGIRERIREAIRLARFFEAWVRDEPGWELSAPRRFSLVCFRREASDEENLALLDRVNRSGELFITHTKIEGRVVLRLAVGNARTTEEDVRRACDVFRREARA